MDKIEHGVLVRRSWAGWFMQRAELRYWNKLYKQTEALAVGF